MPIRTNRGRAAVYRKLWAWPLRSPKHLVGALVLVVGVATLVGWLLPTATDPGARRSAAATATAALSAGAPTVSTGASAGVGAGGRSGAPATSLAPRVTAPTPTSAAAAPEALAVAEAWARAWVNHPPGMTNEAWTAQLAPYTTEEYLPQLRTVDPANIPSSTVTGPATASDAAAAAVEASVPTDNAVLRLTVVATDAGWRITASTLAE